MTQSNPPERDIRTSPVRYPCYLSLQSLRGCLDDHLTELIRSEDNSFNSSLHPPDIPDHHLLLTHKNKIIIHIT